jgi:hypothetical protein
MAVKRIKTEISPDILDTIGKSFKFRHAKGIAEWLKNSLDSYLRLRAAGLESRKGAWPVLLILGDGDSGRPGPNLIVLDFGGATFDVVKEFFLRWGDTSAATHGKKFADAKVTGGHGNGGKFYMREMWKGGARFSTWRDGKFTSLVVDRKEPGTTGYWESQGEPIKDWQVALEKVLPKEEGLLSATEVAAQIEAIDSKLISELNAGKRGFTAILGKVGAQLWSANDVVKGKRWDHQKLVDEIRAAAQSRRPVRELTISVVINGKLALPRLAPEEIKPDQDWEPSEVKLDGKRIGLTRGSVGTLKLLKADHQLVGRLRDHNVISIIDGEGNPLATYRTGELPGVGSTIATFLSGELRLDFPGLEDLVENDREKLVVSGRTEAILSWLGEEVSKLASAIEDAEKSKKRKADLDIASVLNDALNKHAQRFLEEIQSEIMVNYVDDPDGGGPGPEGTGKGGAGGKGGGGGGGKGGKPGSGGTKEEPGGTHSSRRRQFPRVLLSGFDSDPASSSGETKALTKSHPPLWQDDSDRRFNVYWINTDHPFAQETLRRGGPMGNPFKSHQLYMFRDVVQREALRMLQKREAEIAIDRMETELDDFSNRFLGELPYELIASLLDEARASGDRKSKG